MDKKYLYNLTQGDFEYLEYLFGEIKGDLFTICKVSEDDKIKDWSQHGLDTFKKIYRYFYDVNDIRTNSQEKEFILNKHEKEKDELYGIKYVKGLSYLKEYIELKDNDKVVWLGDHDIDSKLTKIIDSVGLNFIRDFIKFCEKCEE